MKNNLYLEAPNYHNINQLKINRETSVFLAGSISGALDWQTGIAKMLLPYFHVFNPRRSNYTNLDPKAEREQITWEFNYLAKASIVLFYFDHATLAPITLLEYGKFLGKNKYCNWQKIYVCIHPDYKRKNDVIIQTELENPQLTKNIFDNLDEMCKTIINENKG